MHRSWRLTISWCFPLYFRGCYKLGRVQRRNISGKLSITFLLICLRNPWPWHLRKPCFLSDQRNWRRCSFSFLCMSWQPWNRLSLLLVPQIVYPWLIWNPECKISMLTRNCPLSYLTLKPDSWRHGPFGCSTTYLPILIDNFGLYKWYHYYQLGTNNQTDCSFPTLISLPFLPPPSFFSPFALFPHLASYQ